MGFDALLGNQRLKDNLRTGIAQGRLSHFYLISGPKGSGKHTLARLLAAAILCRGEEKPCMGCTACRKVMADTHPDFITVVDPEHKDIPVDMVRKIREQMFIRPNEADKKIYMFAQSMRVESQNALLKILEEPPQYGVFILLSENPERLLPTVRSRCTELALQPLPPQLLRARLQQEYPDADENTLTAATQRSGGYLGQALQLLAEGVAASAQTQGFVDSFARKDPMGLVQTLVPMEKWKRDQLLPELERWAEVVQQAVVCRSGMQVMSPMARRLGSERSSQELMQALRHLQRCIEYLQGNVSPAAICGFLQWALR